MTGEGLGNPGICGGCGGRGDAGLAAAKLKVPAGLIGIMVGGRGVAGWPGATGLGDPTVANGWKKKLFAGLVGGRADVTGDAGTVGVGRRVGVGGRAGIVGATADGDTGEGEAGRCVTTVEGSGKFKPWN